MKLILNICLMLLAASTSFVSATVSAQANEQFVPALVYRTGPFAPNGVPWLKQHYGISFGQTKTYDVGLRYRALKDGAGDCVYAFGTDPQIADQKLVVLQDDKAIWPFDHATPIIRKGWLKTQSPKVGQTIAKVNALLRHIIENQSLVALHTTIRRIAGFAFFKRDFYAVDATITFVHQLQIINKTIRKRHASWRERAGAIDQCGYKLLISLRSYSRAHQRG